MTSESNALHLAQSAFEAVCKERDEARDQLKAMREAIMPLLERVSCNTATPAEVWKWIKALNAENDRQTAALTKLKPFLP